MLKTKIKAGAITNLTDARYFAAWDIEWIGFCLDPGSPEYLQPNIVKAIKEWIEGPQLVGEFGLQSAEEIKMAIDALDLQAVQLSPFSPLPEIKAMVDLPIFQELILETPQDIDQLFTHCEKTQAYVDYFVLNGSKNNLNWTSIRTSSHLLPLCQQYPIFLDIQAQPEELTTILEALPLVGLHLKGGEEEKVGYKSFDEVDDWFEALETF